MSTAQRVAVLVWGVGFLTIGLSALVSARAVMSESQASRWRRTDDLDRLLRRTRRLAYAMGAWACLWVLVMLVWLT